MSRTQSNLAHFYRLKDIALEIDGLKEQFDSKLHDLMGNLEEKLSVCTKWEQSNNSQRFNEWNEHFRKAIEYQESLHKDLSTVMSEHGWVSCVHSDNLYPAISLWKVNEDSRFSIDFSVQNNEVVLEELGKYGDDYIELRSILKGWLENTS